MSLHPLNLHMESFWTLAQNIICVIQTIFMSAPYNDLTLGNRLNEILEAHQDGQVGVLGPSISTSEVPKFRVALLDACQ